jgi:hypothetical protein
MYCLHWTQKQAIGIKYWRKIKTDENINEIFRDETGINHLSTVCVKKQNGWLWKIKLQRTQILRQDPKITITGKKSHAMSQNKKIHLGSGSHWQSHNQRIQTGAEQGSRSVRHLQHVPRFLDL